jgi:2-polyprenyl-6-methoxyphenol hydroxylase-like FAD-dependent oxidoreductase
MVVRDSRATVVGGGIGGLTAALLLARIGAEVTMLDRVREPREVGAGLLLQPNGLAVLEGLSLAVDLQREGHRIHDAVIRTPAGAQIFSTPLPDYGPGLDHALAVRRGRLYAVLFGAVGREPAIRTWFGCEVTGARPDGVVEYRSPDGAHHRLSADLVVGADGAASAVRTAGDFGPAVRGNRETYVRGIVDGDDLGLDGEYWTPLGLLGGAPVGGGSTYFYAAAHAPEVAAALARRDLAAFRQVWVDALPASAAVLGRVPRFDALLVNDVTRVDCARFVDGCLALVGDAAHAMAPTLGQGANSAMVDAAVLAVEVAGDRPIAGALRRYNTRRRRPVRRVQDAADRLARRSRMSGPVRRAARDAALRLLSRMGPLVQRQAAAAQQEDPRALLASVAALGSMSVATLGGKATT